MIGSVRIMYVKHELAHQCVNPIHAQDYVTLSDVGYFKWHMRTRGHRCQQTHFFLRWMYVTLNAVQFNTHCSAQFNCLCHSYYFLVPSHQSCECFNRMAESVMPTKSVFKIANAKQCYMYHHNKQNSFCSL